VLISNADATAATLHPSSSERRTIMVRPNGVVRAFLWRSSGPSSAVGDGWHPPPARLQLTRSSEVTTRRRLRLRVLQACVCGELTLGEPLVLQRRCTSEREPDFRLKLTGFDVAEIDLGLAQRIRGFQSWVRASTAGQRLSRLLDRSRCKAERFIQTLVREWAYALPYRSSPSRAADLPKCCTTTITTDPLPASPAKH
jgi:hypothetical protein